jgi:hypothetical protein
MTQPSLGARIVVAVTAITIAISACVNQGLESATPSLQNIRLSALSSRVLWPQALALAQEWRCDAYISNVGVEVRLPNVPSSRSTVSLLFQSPSEDLGTLTVLCNAEGCSSFEFEHTRTLQKCTPIALDDFVLDSSDVLEIGLQHGGETYVHRRTASVLLQLGRHSPSCTGSVQWTVKFADLATTEGLIVVIDPITGEVIEVRD